MVRLSVLLSVTSAFLVLPLATFAEEKTVVSPTGTTTATSSSAPTFPPSQNCTTSTPCRHVMGEVMKIEETYWIKQPNGNELRLLSTKESRLETLPKVGDKIAAQVTSTGQVNALKTIDAFPEGNKAEKPSGSLNDLR